MNEERTFGDRVLEVIAVVLLAVSTLGTAWCGYQASQWSGVQTEYNQQETNHRLEANRQFARAIQTFSYDSSVIAFYAQAVQAHNTRLADFYRTVMARKDLLPFLDKWEATVRAGGTPTPLLEDPQYIGAQAGGYQSEQEAAEQAARAAQQAADRSQVYTLNTILLAVALFFAGVTSSFRYRSARIMLIMLALLTLAIAATRLADLPVA
ncbi:hypothetical protein [Paractinoplanes globisporus]|uniref:DUF4337 domain-containing protein n=1 Tax=Paractinoplanes globisporus TaxID=113565 RepID=A0ABW6W8R1_9ACTN|nr:hypothetical protein [Actinoplanes globisporus]